MKRACIAIVDATRARIFTYDGAEPNGARGGSTDDHREAHLDALEQDFAHQIADELERIVRERAFERVIVVTTPRMLGELRKLDAALQRSELALEYVERDLAQLTSPQIHDHLADLQLISPRRRPQPAPR